MTHAILIIDDEQTLARNLATYLERAGYEVRVCESAESGLAACAEFKPDVVLLDHNLPGTSGLEALPRLKALDGGMHVVMMTGFGGVELAVGAMKAGAADYLTKPVSLNAVKLLLERLIDRGRLESTVRYYAGREAAGSGLDKIIGDSAPMQALRERIARLLESESRLADDDAPAVLIQGETGTGKELVARALHFGGPRRDAPFVELNCGALPAQLVEAELFGYERGAFTDARQRKAGLVETAEGGTLFLDEIGEADGSTQVKLLKLLEDKRFRRVGGLRDQAVNVRIVSASHRSIEQMSQEGRFRADLYFRLRIVEIRVPPLRERGDDIVLLARHFVEQQARRYRRGHLRLREDAERALRQHHWPGNVRELRNVIEQAVLLGSGEAIGAHDLALRGADVARALTGASGDAGENVDRADTAGAARDAELDLDLERTERRLIRIALERTGGNVTQAAKLLGISRDTLRYRLDRQGG